MTAETNSFGDKAADTSAKAKKSAKAAVDTAAGTAQARLNEAIDLADRNFREAAKRIEHVMRESVDTLRTRAEPYRESASQQIDEAQKYVRRADQGAAGDRHRDRARRRAAARPVDGQPLRQVIFGKCGFSEGCSSYWPARRRLRSAPALSSSRWRSRSTRLPSPT